MTAGRWSSPVYTSATTRRRRPVVPSVYAVRCTIRSTCWATAERLGLVSVHAEHAGEKAFPLPPMPSRRRKKQGFDLRFCWSRLSESNPRPTHHEPVPTCRPRSLLRRPARLDKLDEGCAWSSKAVRGHIGGTWDPLRWALITLGDQPASPCGDEASAPGRADDVGKIDLLYRARGAPGPVDGHPHIAGLCLRRRSAPVVQSYVYLYRWCSPHLDV